ncbi:hypothetical protein GW17_00025507 [Ensete ventricosum]|nr:hypothetical protein GW17_00025507 [Ensete ventricosum]
MVLPKSTVDGRFRPLAVDFDRRRSIEGEKGKKKKKRKRRKKEEKKKKEVPCVVLARAVMTHGRRKKEEEKKKGPRIVLARTPSSPAGRPRAVIALAARRYFGKILLGTCTLIIKLICISVRKVLLLENIYLKNFLCWQLIECPSVYEMLPNSGFEWKKKPLVQVWRKLSEEKENVKLEEYDPATCISFFEEALKNNEVLFMLVYQAVF